MSKKVRLAKRDLDYGIYHRTGEKIDKSRKQGADMEEVRQETRIKEMQLMDDIDEAFAIYALADLETEDEISDKA